MANILAGLSQLGLKGLEGVDLYEKEEKKEKPAKQEAPEPQQIDESEFVFPKAYECPVCYKEFKSPTVRSSKIRPAGSDPDMRPRFRNFDALKYDIILCPNCGYAALGRYFSTITPPQAKLVKEGISKTFRPISQKNIFTYDEAFVRYQLALGNAVVKKGRASEKAYLCLKMAWIMRGKKEAIEAGTEEFDGDDMEAAVKELEENEKELLTNALDGFLNARQNETFPMCGMDEVTLDYIITVTAKNIGRYDVVNQMLNVLLVRSGINQRMKDNLLDIKEEMRSINKA